MSEEIVILPGDELSLAIGIRGFLAQNNLYNRFQMFSSFLLALKVFLTKQEVSEDTLRKLDEMTASFSKNLAYFDYFNRIGAPLALHFSKVLSDQMLEIWDFLWSNDLIPRSVLNRAVKGVSEDRIVEYNVKRR